MCGGGKAASRADSAAQVRRLRIQEKLKCGAATEEDVSKQEFNSALPLLPPLVRRVPCRGLRAPLSVSPPLRPV